MEEKRYPEIEEEESVGQCNESAVEPIVYVEDVEVVGNFEDRVPILGPSTLEEVLEDINQSERDFREGRCYPWESIKIMLEDRIRNYAS